MEDVIDKFEKAAQRCEGAEKVFSTDPLDAMIKRLADEADRVGRSWSGSWLGTHSTVYTENFRPPRSGEYFDVHSGTAVGSWYEYAYEAVEAVILKRAGVDNLDPIIEASKAASEAFQQSRDELLPILDALIEQSGSEPLKEIRSKLGVLKPYFSKDEFIKPQMPKSFFTNDYAAVARSL
ncbi:MAG TPA: hypothetical protein VF826_05885, partial [Chloroflexia bacterium]